MAFYTRARTLWGHSPDATSLIRQEDVEKWDKAILDLKRNAYNVLDFGAVGDGVANDVAAIQAAIDNATAPGTVEFFAGTFKIGSALVMKTGVSLKGRGIGATVLSNTGTGDSISYSYATGPNAIDSVIEDLTITSATSTAAAIKVQRCGRIQCKNVFTNGHAYGAYFDFGESNWFENVIFNGATIAGVYLTGADSGHASNNTLFSNCWMNACATGALLSANSVLNVFDNCRFYSNTTGVYFPSTAADVIGTKFNNCWWEANTKNNDLRAGRDTLYTGPVTAGSAAFIESSNYGAYRTKIRDPLDVSSDGVLSSLPLDVELIGDGGLNEINWQQIQGSFPSSARDGSYLRSLGVHGMIGGPIGAGGWGTGAGEKNLVGSVNLADAGYWVTSGGLSGSIADPLNGTSAFRITAGNNVYSPLAVGSALANKTFTAQVWAKSNGGTLKINLLDIYATGENGTKYVRLPTNKWVPVSMAYKFTAAASGTTLAFQLISQGQPLDLYFPVLSVGDNVIPWLPAGRDMSGWAGAYEVFGPNHNIRVYVNNAAPASGTWAVGDEAINYAPAAGGIDRWRCVTAGTPGTWTALGATVTFNTQTGTAYTLVLADAGALVGMNNAAANTLTVPPNASVAFPVGTVITVRQVGAGLTTVAAGSGVTINSRGAVLNLAGQYAYAALVKVATNTWELSGDIA